MLGQMWYYHRSTWILHLATVTYVASVLLLPPNFIAGLFGLLFTVETIAKIRWEGAIYLSSYYGLGFRLMDVLAGPVVLACCGYEFSEGRSRLHIGSALVLLKVLTCRSHMYEDGVTLKEIHYVVRATSYYLRLSCWVFVCFVCFAYYTFRPVSKYFGTLHESMVSLYQISTFDNQQVPILDVKEYLTDWWLVFFLFYILMMGTAYTATMLSFFATYYSKPAVQVDFRFELRSFVYIKDMAEVLGLSTAPSERWYLFKEAEMYLAGFTLWGVLESTSQRLVPWRTSMLALLVVISVLAMVNRLLKADREPINYRRLSTVLRIMKGFGGMATLMTCWLLGWDNWPTVWVYLVCCLLDTVRHNPVLVSLLSQNFRLMGQYILIIVGILYLFAAVIFHQPELAKIDDLKDQLNSFANIMVMNFHVMGYDGWGDLAKASFNHSWVWLIYFLLLILGVGFIIVNVFTAEVVSSIEPRILQELTLAKKQHLKLYYSDFNELARQCQRLARQEGIEAVL